MIDIFVSFPYTHDDPEVVKQRVAVAEEYVAKLTMEGYVVYSTVVAMEALAKKYYLPSEYEYWKRHCRAMVSCSKEVHVLCLEGWTVSPGTTDEISAAEYLAKNIKYIDF